MRDMIIDCYRAGKDKLNPSGRQNHYELMGFDFMLDEDGRVWLIEVNNGPYLGLPNKESEELIQTMLDQTLNLVLDPHFPPSSSYKQLPE